MAQVSLTFAPISIESDLEKPVSARRAAEDRQICLQKRDISAMINDVQLAAARYSNDLLLRDMYIQTRQANVSLQFLLLVFLM